MQVPVSERINSNEVPFSNQLLRTRKTYNLEKLHAWIQAKVVVADDESLPGEMGNRNALTMKIYTIMVFILEILGNPVILSESDEKISKKRFSENEYNILVSERMSLNRSLPDMRLPQ